jgi:hypothetical protein
VGFAIRKRILKSLQARKKGQVRIIEALLTLMIMLSALSVAVSFGGVKKSVRSSELEEVGENMLSILDGRDVIQKNCLY